MAIRILASTLAFIPFMAPDVGGGGTTSPADAALSAINAAVEKGVVSAAGGNYDRSPGVLKGVAHYVKRIPEYFGESGDEGFARLFGIGEESKESKNSEGVFVSKNFSPKAAGNSHVPTELLATALELKKLISDAQIIAMAEHKKFGRPYDPASTKYWKRFVEPRLKAFDLASFTQWVPQLNVRFYFEEVEIEPNIESLFETLPMQSRSEQIPGALNRLKAQRVADNATFSPRYNTSAGFVWSAQDLVCHTVITEDLISDAVPEIFGRLRKEIMYGILRSGEDCIVNGDDSATHMDNDSQVAKVADPTLDVASWKGLRKIALDGGLVHDNAGASVGITTLSALLTKLAKWGKDKADLAWIMGPSVSTKIVTGGIPEILIVQNVTNNATLITGSLFPIFGIRPYESEWVREDLAASGVNTLAGPNTLSSIMLVKRSRFMVGERSPVKIWATPSLANQDQMLMTAKRRMTFAGIPQSATEKSISIARNVAVS